MVRACILCSSTLRRGQGLLPSLYRFRCCPPTVIWPGPTAHHVPDRSPWSPSVYRLRTDHAPFRKLPSRVRDVPRLGAQGGRPYKFRVGAIDLERLIRVDQSHVTKVRNVSSVRSQSKHVLTRGHRTLRLHAQVHKLGRRRPLGSWRLRSTLWRLYSRHTLRLGQSGLARKRT